MTRKEIVANTKLMLSGGLQEPRDLIALTVWALGSNPPQLNEVRSDRALVKAAVEETLRWAGPVGTSTRQTTRAHGAGRGLLGARGADRRRPLLGEPRPEALHGSGPLRHPPQGRRAPGVRDRKPFLPRRVVRPALARVSLDVLLDRLPNLRLDHDRPATLSGWEFRAPDSTWVRWDPR